MKNKKTIKKKAANAKKVTKKIVKQHSHFMAVLILFSGFSLYAVASFFTSTNDYIDTFYTSTLDSSEISVVDVVSEPSYTVFNDVADDAPHAVAIQKLLNAGVLEGYADGSFKPDSVINRAELLKVLSVVVDADFGGKVLSECFSDVTDQWFAPYVCYAKESGWVNGYADGTYKPADNVMRAGAVKIVFEALEYPACEGVVEAPYTDVAIDQWFAPYACAAKRDSIVSPASEFNPTGVMTRAQFSQILFNVMSAKGLI